MMQTINQLKKLFLIKDNRPLNSLKSFEMTLKSLKKTLFPSFKKKYKKLGGVCNLNNDIYPSQYSFIAVFTAKA